MRVSLKTFVISVLLVSISVGTIVRVFSTSSTVIPAISGGAYLDAPTFTVWTEGSSYFAKNASGAIVYSGTNASYLVSTVINALSSNLGGVIYFSSGNYYFSNSIIIDKNEVTIEGDAQNTRFFLNAGANCPLIIISNSTVNSVNFIYIRELALMGKKQVQGNGSYYGIDIQGYAGDIFITNLLINDFQNSGIFVCPKMLLWNLWIQSCEIEGCGDEGIWLYATAGLHNVHITDDYLFGNKDGLRIDDVNTRAVDIEENTIWGNLQRGVLLEGVQYTDIVGNQIFDNSVNAKNTYDGIYIGQFSGRNSYHITISGNTITNEGFYNTQRDGIFIADLSDHLTIVGNDLYGNLNSSIHIAVGAARSSAIANNNGYP